MGPQTWNALAVALGELREKLLERTPRTVHATRAQGVELAARTVCKVLPTWCGEAGWPNLSEFILRVSDWYYEHVADLPVGSVSDLSVYDANLLTLG